MRFANLLLNKIDPNPGNPRGVVKQDDKLGYLADSIKRFGVMVPIVVTPRGSKYFLIDGERRYHAAKQAGLKRIPSYIVGKTEQGDFTDRELLYRMFQIHHLREQWDAVQQCRALEVVYREVLSRSSKESGARAQLKALVGALAEETGIDERTAFDRVKFLRWPRTIKNKLYENPSEKGYSYILEIEDKIIIPALANYPAYFEVVDADEVRQDLFRKLERGLVAQEVRLVAPYFRAELDRKSDRTKVLSILDKLRTDIEYDYEDAEAVLHKALPHVLAKDPPTPRRLLGLVQSLEAAVESFNVETIATAQRRAKAPIDELLSSISSLSVSLADLRRSIEEK